MRYPELNGPRDLPATREWIRRVWNHRSPGGIPTMAGLHPKDYRFVTRTLPTADLWWVDEEATDLVAEAASTLPADVVLTPEMPTCLSGMAVFARQLAGTDARDGNEIELGAVLWGPASFRGPGVPEGAQGLSIVAWQSSEPGLGLTPAQMSSRPMMNTLSVAEQMFPSTRVTGQGDSPASALAALNRTILGPGKCWACLGRADWVFGTRLDSMLGAPGDDPETEAKVAASMAEDRRLVACLWQLARTPVTHISEAAWERRERRTLTRKLGEAPRVRVMALRPQEGTHAADVAGEPGEGREYRHRWVVRPHWRWQAHGKGRAERKLILVGPYVKGPEGAPLLGGERVWKLAEPRPSVVEPA